ncbi:MAG: hypothetical protein EXS18_04285 [Verrucomicrobiae bacterium]|nr:hypothetical protein [Verrucomicrobiae bacterium]
MNLHLIEHHPQRVLEAFRRGGLLSALPPELASKRLDAASKALKDVTAQQWLEWFNGPVQQSFQEHGFFDPAGVFIGDASDLFVPDNPAYEGSSVLWFDEHNRPVDYDTLSPPERLTAHRERCYKWVSLLHLRGPQPCYMNGHS